VKGTINGKSVEFKAGQTILETARQAGHFIPTLCEMGEIKHTPGTCRVCEVEIRRSQDPVPYLVTSCNTPMEEGLEVFTRTQKVRDTQRLQVELLLADHNQNCASCIRHGNCELQDVAQFVGLQQTHFSDPDFFRSRTIDVSSPSLQRDMTKCIRCLRCVKVCRDIQGTDVLVIAEHGLGTEIVPRDVPDIQSSDCISCGQCTLVCPVGALAERDDSETVIDHLYAPDLFTVFQFAPAVRIALGEEFNMPPGSIVTGKIITALKKLGADVVLDTNFTADLVVMEEGTELLERIRTGGPLPLITSCSSGWINFMEKNYPEVIPNVSSVKSPQMCFGAIAKSYLADRMKVDPAKMRVISIMPCIAKKEEAKRPEFTRNGQSDVDVVLTTREFARLLKREGIWLPGLDEGEFDNPWMGEYTGAGALFGTTGGVSEAVLRTLNYLITGTEIKAVEVPRVRGTDGVRQAEIDLGGFGKARIAIAHGTKAARPLIEAVRAGTSPFAFIEIMGCPGGCMGGGGQPRNKKSYQTFWHPRQQAIYQIDRHLPIRQAHNNPQIRKIYEEFLESPLSPKAHEILHTRYHSRKHQVHHTIREIWKEIRERRI
jgi:ferredoxin hydrogenase gamma subunit